jgi:hypothetical protein
MTEGEWACSIDPGAMIEFLRVSGRASERQFRLYACAVVRRVWHLLNDERSRRAVEVAEGFLEGRVSADQVMTATVAAWDALDRNAPASMAAFVAATGGLIVPALAAWGATNAAAGSVAKSGLVRLNAWSKGYVARDIGSAWAEGNPDQEQNWEHFATARWANDEDADKEKERAAQADLLRCIVGPLPFARVHIDPTLLTVNAGLLPRLAQAAYDDRQLPEGVLDAARVNVLADALEECGHADAGLVGHLRGPGPHYRGCHALDAVLGK